MEWLLIALAIAALLIFGFVGWIIWTAGKIDL